MNEGCAPSNVTSLDWNLVPFCGRHDEAEQLSILYQEAAAGKGENYRTDNSGVGKKVVCFVSGPSGIGKTTLVRRCLQQDTRASGSLFCMGKFDTTHNKCPYSAIVDALTELGEQLNPNRHGPLLQSAFDEGDLWVLTDFIPSLERVLFPSMNDSFETNRSFEEDSSSLSTLADGWTLERLTKLLTRLLTTVASSETPIIMCVDDLQWSDLGSLELFHHLASPDISIPHLFLVGLYRNNEVHAQHPLQTKVLHKLQQQRAHYTDIVLTDWELQDVTHFISGLLRRDERSLVPLAELIFSKTAGNVFFIIQFMKLIQHQKWLYYSFASFQWEWHLGPIETETNITENVADLVLRGMKRLPKDQRMVLQIGACLGQRLVADVLAYVLAGMDLMEHGDGSYSTSNEHGRSTNLTATTSGRVVAELTLVNDVVDVLDDLVEEGLIIRYAEHKYRFSHDRLRQAAYSLVPPGTERSIQRHWQIGRLLYDLARMPNAHEWLLIVAVDQLNRGSSTMLLPRQQQQQEQSPHGEVIHLVQLNLQAAKAVAKKSAFFPAADFLRAAVDLLVRGNCDHGSNENESKHSSVWEQHYDLCLELYSFSLEIESRCGHVGRVRNLVDQVLTHGKTTLHKFRAYFTLVNTLGIGRYFREAVDIGANVIRELGEPWPKKVGLHHILWERSKVKRLVRNKTNEDILALPRLLDEKRIAVIQMLQRMVGFGWFLGDFQQVLLACMRMPKITLSEGLCKLSGVSMYWWAFCCAAFKEINDATRFGNLSFALNEKMVAYRYTAQTTVTAYTTALHFRTPLIKLMDKFLDGYHIGFKTGEIDQALEGAACYLGAYFYAGLSLPAMVDDAKAYCAQMEQFHYKSLLGMARSIHQCALNLMGRSRDPTKLQGEAMDCDNLPEEEKENTMTQASILLMHLQLAYYFHDWLQVEKVAEELTHHGDQWPIFNSQPLLFFKALSWYALFQHTRRRKYKYRAIRDTNTMGKWVKLGLINCPHLFMLLQAERVALEGMGRKRNTKKHEKKTRIAYDSAIRVFARTGYTQNEALANERAGMWFLAQNRNSKQEDIDGNSSHLATRYLGRARVLYSEWGAAAKVDFMTRLYADQLKNVGKEEDEPGSLGFTCCSLRGRRRFSFESSESLLHNRDFVGIQDKEDEDDQGHTAFLAMEATTTNFSTSIELPEHPTT